MEYQIVKTGRTLYHLRAGGAAVVATRDAADAAVAADATRSDSDDEEEDKDDGKDAGKDDN